MGLARERGGRERRNFYNNTLVEKKTMITIFTVPKAFKGKIATNQENAIKSWQKLTPKPEIILYGDDPGVAKAAKKLRVKHVPKITRNEYGTPLIDGVFKDADKRAKNDLLCFVHTDIIFLNNYTPLIKKIPCKQFLVVGQRSDVRIDKPIDFSRSDWRDRVRNHLARNGTFLTMGMDYFIYRKGLFADMPPFAIGRGHWDSWLPKSAINKKVVLIDATPSIVAVHQNHDYAHIKSSPDKKYWKGIEAERNLELSGFVHERPPNFYDARYLLTPQGLKPARSLIHLSQQVYDFSTKHKVLFPLYLSLKLARKIGPIVHRLKKPKPIT